MRVAQPKAISQATSRRAKVRRATVGAGTGRTSKEGFLGLVSWNEQGFMSEMHHSAATDGNTEGPRPDFDLP